MPRAPNACSPLFLPIPTAAREKTVSRRQSPVGGPRHGEMHPPRKNCQTPYRSEGATTTTPDNVQRWAPIAILGMTPNCLLGCMQWVAIITIQPDDPGRSSQLCSSLSAQLPCAGLFFAMPRLGPRMRGQVRGPRRYIPATALLELCWDPLGSADPLPGPPLTRDTGIPCDPTATSSIEESRQTTTHAHTPNWRTHTHAHPFAALPPPIVQGL